MATDERVGQGYRAGLERGRELVRDGRHLDRSDHQILAQRSELEGYVAACAAAQEELAKAKNLMDEAKARKEAMDKANEQAQEELEILLVKHREYKISNFSASVLSKERVDMLVRQDRLRAEIEALEARRDELFLAQPVKTIVPTVEESSHA